MKLVLEKPASGKNTKRGAVPRGWRVVRLCDICKQDRQVVEPGSPRAKSRPYLSLEHIEANTGRILRVPGDAIEDEGQSTTFAFDARHVLYGKLRPYLNKVALPDYEGRCTTELIPLLPEQGVSRRYLAWLLRRPETVEAAMREKTGARMPRADMEHVLSVQVGLPLGIAEQDRLVEQLESLISAVRAARCACEQQIAMLDACATNILRRFPRMFGIAANGNGGTPDD